ncbi:hypothetical protein TNCV_2678721 [Trichonephila clavipes]|nr:hypothetical protein TNCV_2678721 [Trichonephila clavipes]
MILLSLSPEQDEGGCLPVGEVLDPGPVGPRFKPSISSTTENTSRRHLLDWCSTPPSRSALSHLYSNSFMAFSLWHFIMGNSQKLQEARFSFECAVGLVQLQDGVLFVPPPKPWEQISQPLCAQDHTKLNVQNLY